MREDRHVAGRNLINVESVTKAYGHRPLLDKVSLGVSEADRIGIVGRNGAGKSTLLRVLAQTEKPDDGRVSMGNDVRLGFLRQRDDFPPDLTVLEAVVGDRPTHEWAVDPNVREVLEGLLGGFDEELLARTLGTMSGGERRRVDLARLLITDLDVLLLDEPTNHLDVEVIAWLAAYLKTRPRLGLLVVTHDRWFLDEVCENMWEVVDGGVEEYDGGYSAYVLAKAERMRQASVSEQRRNMLIRKELAWLRRGAPARTSKPIAPCPAAG
jgi:ATP-binding cassette subfamily F protein uup